MLRDGERADHVLAELRRARAEWPGASWLAVHDAVLDIVRRRLLIEGAAASEEPSGVLLAWHVYRDLEAPAALGADPAIRQRLAGLAADFRTRESIPEWLDRVGSAELGGEAWRDAVTRLNESPRLYVRVNTLKTTRAELAARLGASGLTTREVSGFPDALEVESSRSLYELPEHAEGLFEVQDAASQGVAQLLGVLPGMRVVDGCAGSGGKTLHLAALMRNRGRLLALDVDARKLETLRLRARRAGAGIVEARVVDTTKVVKRRHESADRLLLDVPCSGLGVLRRNPETKWRLSPEALDRLRELQREILRRYAPLTKPGGMMAYVTCSVLPSEGEAQVRWFLEAAGPTWRIELERRFGPPAEDTDCFYIAVLTRVC